MMLDVVAVVEEQEIVDAPVMTGRAAGMLVVALELAEPKTDQPAGQVDRKERPRRDRGPCDPEPDHERRLDRHGTRPSNGARGARVMREMPGPPQALRHAEDQAQEDRVDPVEGGRDKKRPVDEIVRDGVRIPPQPNRDERNGRHGEQ